MDSGFTLLLELALAVLLLAVIVSDLRSLTIPNRLCLAVALLALPFWIAAGLAPWPDVMLRIALALLLFAVFALMFRFSLMGGGDVKLAAPLALWFAPVELLRFLVWMALAGLALTLLLLAFHRARRRPGRPAIPYGVAIAAGGMAILAERFLNQFA